MSDDSKLKPALAGGALAGVLSAIPLLNSLLYCACCAQVLLGGGLACWLYLRDRPRSAKPAYGDGAMTGLIAGVVGGVISVILNIPVNLLMRRAGMGPDIEDLRPLLDQMEAPEVLVQFVTDAVAGKVTLVGLIFNFALTVPLFAVFGMLGGLLAVAIFFKKPPAGPEVWTPPSSPPPVWVPQAPAAPVAPAAPSEPAADRVAGGDDVPPPPPGNGERRS